MGFNGSLKLSICCILCFLTTTVLTCNQTCVFSQYLTLGQAYYIYNVEYPRFYNPGAECLWYARSPEGTTIFISCEEIRLPSVKNCKLDKLKISLTGNTSFPDSQNYCGTGSISLVSKTNRIAVGLFGSSKSKGGRFICTLTALSNENSQIPSTPPSDLCDCGWKKGTKIVGGVPTLVNEYPAMAALVDAETAEIICGATIISNRYVLTAAHCVRSLKLANTGVLVGDWNITTGLDTNASALYVAETFWEHPDFQLEQQLNDLAIVKTKESILFSLYVGPICLPFLYTYETFESANVTIMGWGQEFFNGPVSDVLLTVDLEVISHQKCQQQLSSSVITYNQICTYAKGKDACQMDSGGPVFWQDPNTLRLQLIGVISYGYGCATSRPGVSTRVSSYLAWIVSVTKETNYCVK